MGAQIFGWLVSWSHPIWEQKLMCHFSCVFFWQCGLQTCWGLLVNYFVICDLHSLLSHVVFKPRLLKDSNLRHYVLLTPQLSYDWKSSCVNLTLSRTSCVITSFWDCKHAHKIYPCGSFIITLLSEKNHMCYCTEHTCSRKIFILFREFYLLLLPHLVLIWCCVITLQEVLPLLLILATLLIRYRAGKITSQTSDQVISLCFREVT